MPDKKFKYKALDLDLDKYIYNLSQNVESWVNSKDWTDSLKQEFWNAYDIYKTKLQETDGGGYSNLSINDKGLVVGPELTNIDADDYYYNKDGKRISSDEYTDLKARKQKRYSTFEANRLVATYLNVIAKAYSLALPQKKESIKAPKKESFTEYFIKTKGLKDDEDYNYFLELDALDLNTKKRGFTERIKIFNNVLDNYISTLEGDDKSKFSDLKTYLETKGFDSMAKVKMLELGIDNKFFENYFNPYNNVSIDDAAYEKYLKDLAEIAEKQANQNKIITEKAEKKAKDEKILTEWNKFLVNYNFEPKTLNLYDLEGLERLDSFESNPLNKDLYDAAKWVRKIEETLVENENLDELVNTLLNNSIENQGSLNRHVLYWLLYNRGITDTFSGKNVIRIKGDDDVKNGHTLIWDPSELKLQLVPLILSGSGEKELQEYFKKSRTDLFPKKPYVLPYSKGGLIKKLQYGGMLEYYDKTIRINAKNKKVSLEKYKKDNESLLENWDGNDWVDLFTIGADLVSAGSALSPGVGTVISAVAGGTSTATQFVNDIFKDGFLWSDLASFATNAGADVIGLVPGLGVAGKLGKHISKLQKYLPKVIKILGIAGTAYQTSAVMETLGRISSGEELKKSDLQTLALIGKGLLIGGRKLGNSRNKKMSGTKAYPFENNSGEIEYKLFTGADAQALSKAKDYSTINEILSKYKASTYTPVVQEDYTFKLRIGRIFGNEPKQYNVMFNPVNVRKYKKNGTLRETETYSIPKAFEMKKNGGIISKFQLGGTSIRNTFSTADWFLHMLNTDAMLNYLNSININNYVDFNDLLNSWYSNKINTKYSPSISNVLYSDDVKNRQIKYNGTGLNANIENLVDQGIIIPKGYSGDNSESGWSDGYFGEQEYLRHFGTIDSWKGNESKLLEIIKMFADKGLEYSPDENGMYILRPIVNIPKYENHTLQGTLDWLRELKMADPKQKTRQIVGYTDPFTDEKQGNEKFPTKSYLGDILNLGISLGRALYADKTNRRITDLAIQGEKPYLIDPFVYNRYVQGNLDAINLGEQEAAKLNNTYDKYTDPVLNFAIKFEKYKLGLDRVRLGRMLDNQAVRLSGEMVWQQNKENALNEHETSLKNRLSILKSEANKNKYEQAYLAKQHEIWDTFGKEFLYNLQNKLQELTQQLEVVDKNYIQEKIKQDLKTFQPDLSDEVVNLWNLVNNGTITLNPDDAEQMLLYKTAKQAYQRAVWKALSNYVGAKTYRLESNNYTPSITLKNGGKIKERIANAERLFKTIKSDLDRNEKKLDRLFKSLYTLKNKVK